MSHWIVQYMKIYVIIYLTMIVCITNNLMHVSYADDFIFLLTNENVLLICQNLLRDFNEKKTYFTSIILHMYILLFIFYR